MMKWILFCLCCLQLTGCFSRSNAMTRESYDQVYLGTTVADLKATLGEPYAVYRLSSNREEYEYIERFAMGEELVYENHYFFTVTNGQVVNKRITQENRPAYDLLWREDPNYPSYP